VREVANLNGHTATFMAKPIGDGFGSSQHIHQSMWLDGVNLFHDPDDPDRLSRVARQYVAGVLATLREFTAIYAPTVNSYKRLSPNSAAGTACAWAVQSRSVSVRVINDSPASTRIELRTPGADANPHLVMAACLAGGLWGIEQQLDPGPAYRGNAYLDDSLETVPGSLAEAAELFAASDVAKQFFGEEAVRYYAATRRIEAAQFAAAVTDWEVRRYLCRV
jgi:glutamine synthetase